MFVVRWFWAFGNHGHSSRDFFDSLKWEMKPLAGVRAAEWIPQHLEAHSYQYYWEYWWQWEWHTTPAEPGSHPPVPRGVYAVLRKVGDPTWVSYCRTAPQYEARCSATTSLMQTGIGFVYETSAVRRRFQGDVWSHPSKLAPEEQRQLHAKYPHGLEAYEDGHHNECWVTGAPVSVVVAGTLKAGAKRKVLFLAKQEGLPVYEYGAIFDKSRLKKIA